MSDIIKAGAGLIFMKVGTHAKQGLEEIIARKAKEIVDTGYGMWGYGGNTCHPRTMVQPFAEDFAKRGGPVYLCMEEMDSNHFAEPLRASRYSIDGVAWRDVPSTINVLGSRFALVIDELRRERFTLPLHETRVAVGISQGRNGSRYVQGRADKACLEVIPASERPNDVEERDIEIHLVARLRPPYAVFLSEEDGKVA
jgi:hypothetical protein